MENQLDQLKAMTTVVADTGDIEAIRTFKPQDATTNPSLLLKASQIREYYPLLEQARDWALKQGGSDQEQLANMNDKFATLIGADITRIIPGRISTEVDARLSFNTQATIERAHKLIDLYEASGIGRDRVLIKIASTWEGIEAARLLEREGIQCNLTLLFSFAQAVAAAEAGAHLISPFVGRILDWYKTRNPEADYTGTKDPGVQSVSRIYNHFKAHGYETVVMGASFRNIGEIQALAGCDRLTISPVLMQELADTQAPLEQALAAQNSQPQEARFTPDEEAFRWAMNEDAMANEKLAEGIRNFAKDQETLEQRLANIA